MTKPMQGWTWKPVGLLAVAMLALPQTGCSGKTQFGGSAAMASLQKQVAFGPRVPGTPAHDACRDYLMAALKPNADRVQIQHFTYRRTINPTAFRQTLKIPSTLRIPHSSTFPMDNIVAVVNGTDGKPPAFLLCAHWDTRPTADNEKEPEDRLKPIPGANDGASGAAVLVELARVLHAQRPAHGVIMAFWDGEDLGPGEDDMYVGAKYYATHPVPNKPAEGILLDMIGDADLDIYKERGSEYANPALNTAIFAAAAKLGYGKQFIPEARYSIGDDHLPLIIEGIRVVDLIDFDYPAYPVGSGMATTHWHTLTDTPDKCSAASLEAVGRTLTAVVMDRK